MNRATLHVKQASTLESSVTADIAAKAVIEQEPNQLDGLIETEDLVTEAQQT